MDNSNQTFFSGPVVDSPRSALGWTAVGIPAYLGLFPLALALILLRFVAVGPVVLAAVVVYAIVVNLTIGISYVMMKRVSRRELACGYTTLATRSEVPRIDPETRLIIRHVGEPEPNAEQWRTIQARVRELKAQQRARDE